MAGFNFIMDMNQRSDRKWANRMLFGMEHSGFHSGNIKMSQNIQETNSSNNCECESNPLINNNNKNNYLKKYTRGVSLNFGIELYKGFYLLTGITNYNHVAKINKKKINQYRTNYIDFGVKYYIKHNNWYFSPTIKFNPEQTSYGIGVSWNHL